MELAFNQSKFVWTFLGVMIKQLIHPTMMILIGQLIKLFIDIEENTRTSASDSEKLIKGLK